ncbi:MAG: aminotransferase class IV [Planctomycetota bacterium]
MTTRVHVGGTVRSPEDATISVFDHGFLFAHSIYEVARTYRRVPFRIDAHFDRLEGSASALEIPLPPREEMVRAIRDTLGAAGNDDAYIRIVVTRGTGELNISPETCESPNLIVFVKDWSGFPLELYQKGISVIVAKTARTGVADIDPAVKSGNYANSIAALLDARRRGARDALMLGSGGQVSEGTTSNVFAVFGRTVKTPPRAAGILSGITRSIVLDVARQRDFEALEQPITLDELLQADEVFFSSTLKEVMPVTRIDEKAIGSGTPGPVTEELAGAFRDHVADRIREQEPWW